MDWSDPFRQSGWAQDERRNKEEREQRLLDRLDQRLSTVYPRNQQGIYKWYNLDAETVAQITVRLLAERPEWWEHFVHRSIKSGQAWRVLELLVEDLWERSWVDLLIAPGQEQPAEAGIEWSPLFRWIIARAVGNLKNRGQPGRDPGALEWRDVWIVLTVRDIVQVGRRSATSNQLRRSACRVVGDRVGLSYDSVLKIWMAGRRAERRLQRPQ